MPDRTAGSRVAGRGAGYLLRAPAGAIAAALVLGGCWFPKDRGQRLEARLDRDEDTYAARPPSEDRKAAEEQARRVDAKMTELQGKVDELAAANQQAGTERAARSDKLSDELARLRAAMEKLARRLDAVEQGVAQLRTAPPARGLAKAPRPPQAAAVATREKQEVAEPPPEPSGVFALAREQEAKGQKEVARDLYREYVEKFPRDPNAAHAHYRLGELAYGDHKYPEAIVEYGKVAQDFPHAEEAPDALYRTAESMLAIDLRDDAMVVLSEIPTRYPTSAAAARAKERLADLKGGGGAKKK